MKAVLENGTLGRIVTENDMSCGVVTINAISGSVVTGASLSGDVMCENAVLMDTAPINCIIVKDLSRFARNYIEAGRYLEEIFPQLGIRFIAVNDHYDSLTAQDQSELLLPFQNLINDAYCRDISTKIKSQFALKQKKGDFIGSYAPFGYQKDPENHNHLLPDAYAADVIRDIFHWKTAGMSNKGIARRLNEQKTPSPAAYKKQNGASFATAWQTGDEAHWSATAIGNILRNETYLGFVVQGKTTTPNFRVKRRVKNAEVEWVRVAHCHEALVSPEEFETVQRLMGLSIRIAPGHDVVYQFNGLLFCKDCGSPMIRKVTCAHGRQYVYYFCAQSQGGRHGCTTHSIMEGQLEEAVLEAVHKQLVTGADLAMAAQTADSASPEQAAVSRLRFEQALHQKGLADTIAFEAALYGDLKVGILAKSEYMDLKERYKKRVAALKERIAELECLMRHAADRRTPAEQWMIQFRVTPKLPALDRSMVVHLIDKIFICEGKRVELFFRYGHSDTGEAACFKENPPACLPACSHRGGVACETRTHQIL